jgi:hypothetical protein
VDPAELQAQARREAAAELWRRRQVWPLFEMLLDRDQLADARAIFAGVDIQRGQLPQDNYVLDISRQRGKSWLLCTIAAVLCHCLERFFIKYAAQEKLSVRAIVQPTFDAILSDCPAELKPRFDGQDNVWEWPNKSQVRAAGCNAKGYEALRGQKAHVVMKDEAAFYDDYDAVDRVLTPQLTTTKGFGLDASTPPETPGHPYSVVAEAARLRGRYSHRTIYDHPRMTPEEVEAFIAREAAKKGLTVAQFKDTSYFKREYLCEHVIEEGRAIVPEWAHVDISHCVRELPRPEHYTAYTVVDPGETNSLFVGLHGYWDFMKGLVVVEDETVKRYPSTTEAGDALAATEKRLWDGDKRAGRIDSVLRFCDVDHKLVRDLADAPWSLHFSITAKHNADAARGAARSMVGNQQIIIHPRCHTLLLTLKTGIWNKQRTSYEFNELTGHADAWDALVYWIRNLQKTRNPEPPRHLLPEELRMGVRHANKLNMGQRRESLVVKPLK